MEIAGLGGRDFFVNNLARGIDFFDDDAFVQNGGPFADIQKSVGLLARNERVQLVAIFDLASVVVILSDFDDQLVGFMIFEADKIQLLGTRLAGVPDLVEVGLDSHGPAQHQGIKVQFIYPFLNEHRPLEQVRLHIDADLFPGILGDGQNGFADVVAAVGYEGKLQRPAVLFKPALLIGPPSGLGQQFQGCPGDRRAAA